MSLVSLQHRQLGQVAPLSRTSVPHIHTSVCAQEQIKRNSGSSADIASYFHRRLHREFSNSPDTLCQSTMTELVLLRKSQVILFTRTRQSIGGFGPRLSPSMSINERCDLLNRAGVLLNLHLGWFVSSSQHLPTRRGVWCRVYKSNDLTKRSTNNRVHLHHQTLANP